MVLANHRLVILSGESSRHATRDRFGQKHIHGGLSEEGGGEGKDRGHTSSVSRKMREALFVLRHTSARQCQVSTSGARPRDGSLSLAKTSRDFRYIPSAVISQFVSRCRGRQIGVTRHGESY